MGTGNRCQPGMLLILSLADLAAMERAIAAVGPVESRESCNRGAALAEVCRRWMGEAEPVPLRKPRAAKVGELMLFEAAG